MLVPVIRGQEIKAWPKNAEGGRAVYMTVGDALSRSFPYDAHIAAYSVPTIERRLDHGALDDSEHLATAGGSIPMMLALFDIDAEHAHKAMGGDAAVPARDDWWLLELAKLARLLAAHPGLFIYRTRGGYRVVGVLPKPEMLTEPEHAAVWWRIYCTWIAYLRRAFGIVADSTKEWQRLFRLPHATRDGGNSPERRETIGDPHSVGGWAPELTGDDRTEGKKLAKKKATKPRAEKERAGQTCTGEGVLFHALSARALIRSTLEVGKWSVTCPRADEHSSDSDTGTVLFGPGEGEVLGWGHCSHSGHGHDRWTSRDWLSFFSEVEIEAARAAAGVLEEEAAPQKQPDGRPTIRVTSDLHTAVDAAVAILPTDGTLYKRDGELVHLTRAGDDDVLGFVSGTPRISLVLPANLLERLSRCARWERYDGRSEDYVPTSPPPGVAQAVAARREWAGVRELVGIAEAPFMRPDGSICSEPGYDKATGCYLDRALAFEPIPDFVTHEMAKAAWAELTEPLSEFPWASPAAMSAGAAVVLTLLARYAINGSIPMFGIDATTRGTGKSLFADVVSLIPTGRCAPRMTFPTQEEELEKVLSAYGLRGSSFVNFDNVDRPLKGGALDKVLTAVDFVDLRVLGKTELVSVRWRALLMCTGNNLQPRGDTPRRTLSVRMESRLQNPEDRNDFKRADLRSWVRENRPRLVRAALVVLRAYVCASRPDLGLPTWGGFEAWSALIPRAIVWAGGVNPMLARVAEDETADPELGALRVVLERLPAFAGGGGITVKRLVDGLYADRLQDKRHESSRWRSDDKSPDPDAWDSLREALETIAPMRGARGVDAQRLGLRFRHYRGRVVDGKCLEFKTDGHSKTNKWHVATIEQDAGSSGDLRDFSKQSSGTVTPSTTQCTPRQLPDPGQEVPRTSLQVPAPHGPGGEAAA